MLRMLRIMLKVTRTQRMRLRLLLNTFKGITVFKFVIGGGGGGGGGISSDIRSEILFYGDASAES